MNATINPSKNPPWWTKESDSSWENVKAALKRDWDQTKHDLGAKVPNTNQKACNTIRQAEGKEGIPPRGLLTYDELEPAVRFGHGAKAVYGEEFFYWDDELEARLAADWEEVEPTRKQTWMQDRAAMRYAWEYEA